MQTDNFLVTLHQNGADQQVKVVIDPSTDDVDTYVCYVGDERITQIRKEGDLWKQLWGELSSEEVNKLGSQIDEAMTR